MFFIKCTIFFYNDTLFHTNSRRTLKINVGIACSDRANEVEPRPNEDGVDDYSVHLCNDGIGLVSL
ncbi:MAG: hypothetical protein LBG80_00440 [Bacteroidales bacterium]|nr:hypothetical protein [Bacteroidales bacterium]